MFLTELVVGLVAGSAAVVADSLDMLGDSLVYAFSLYVVGRGVQWRAGAALLKGGIMLALGFGVLANIVWKLLTQEPPTVTLMSAVALVAFVANGLCRYLLTCHRADDINMRSTWICSRNDILANIYVLIAAAGVHWSGTIWPDIFVSVMITAKFVRSAVNVLNAAWPEFRIIDAVSGDKEPAVLCALALDLSSREQQPR
jgi:Co/Zn/Cd efflux system component